MLINIPIGLKESPLKIKSIGASNEVQQRSEYVSGNICCVSGLCELWKNLGATSHVSVIDKLEWYATCRNRIRRETHFHRHLYNIFTELRMSSRYHAI
jgi:hypothetical protein